MAVLDTGARSTRTRLRRTAVGFALLWCVALAAFATINVWAGLQSRPYLLEFGSDAGDRFETNVRLLLSWVGCVASVGLVTWVRLASTIVLVGTPVVTIGALVLADQVILPIIYSGVRF